MSNPVIHDLETLAAEWAKKYMTTHKWKTKVKWVDINATKHEMSRFKGYKVSFVHNQPIVYTQREQPTPMDPFVFTACIVNKENADAMHHVTKSETTSSELSWSVTEGFSSSITNSVEISAGATIEGVAEVGGAASSSITFELNLSSTQQQSTTVIESWEIDQDVPCLAQKSTRVVTSIVDQATTYDWSWETVMKGWVAVYFDHKVDCRGWQDFTTKPVTTEAKGEHHLWFFLAADVFNQIDKNRDEYTPTPPGFTANTANGTVTFTARGTLTARGGVAVNTLVTSEPLSSAA